MPIGSDSNLNSFIHPLLDDGGVRGLNRFDQTCTVQRDSVSGGKVAGQADVTGLVDVVCTPLHPLSQERMSAEGLDRFAKVYSIAIGATGVKHGDTVIFDSADYAVIHVAELRGYTECLVEATRARYGA